MEKFHIKKIAIFSKKDLKVEKSFLLNLISFLKKENKSVFVDENTAAIIERLDIDSLPREKLAKSCDLIITLGGDGTLISGSHFLENKKVLFLGVNFGRLGFLTEIKNTNLLCDDLKRIFDGKYFLDERSMLRITIYREGKKIDTFLALNEAVINQGNLARIISLKVDINRKKVAQFKADGLVIATPTGSTAHSLSAGGPVVHPSLDALLMTPICPVTLSSRPILLPNDKNIRVSIDTDRKGSSHDIALTIDGQNHLSLKYGDQINIRKSSKKVCFVRLQEESYYKNLRSKIGWAA